MSTAKPLFEKRVRYCSFEVTIVFIDEIADASFPVLRASMMLGMAMDVMMAMIAIMTSKATLFLCSETLRRRYSL